MSASERHKRKEKKTGEKSLIEHQVEVTNRQNKKRSRSDTEDLQQPVTESITATREEQAPTSDSTNVRFLAYYPGCLAQGIKIEKKTEQAKQRGTEIIRTGK